VKPAAGILGNASFAADNCAIGFQEMSTATVRSDGVTKRVPQEAKGKWPEPYSRQMLTLERNDVGGS